MTGGTKRSASSFYPQSAGWLIPGLIVLVAGLTLLGTGIHLVTESWWFQAIGLADVFWTRITWQVIIWVVTFVAYALFVWGNYALAMRVTRDRRFYFLDSPAWQSHAESLPRYIALTLIGLLALASALSSVGTWETTVKYLNPSTFGVSDPIFMHDVGFYVFQLPFYVGLQQGVLGLLLWTLMIAVIVYALKGEIRPERGWKYFLTGEVKAHLCLLLTAIAIVIALGFWLQRYELLYSTTGVVFGAGYTDVNARLAAYGVMAFVTLAIATLFILSLWRSGFSLPLVSIALYLSILLLVNGLYPWFQQKFVVEPNELEKERPFIENSIAFTRQAYDLDQVQTVDFPVQENLDRTDLERNITTLQNIRLWDYQPLLKTYQQLQEIRSYYQFLDVDIDRYTLGSNYRQVALAARELDYDAVSPKAKTWVNQRLKYTHGYGVVMSPVNQVTADGLPELFIKDIPPKSKIDLALDQPRIYYGEATKHYVFTGTSTDEFDFPQGDENADNRYDGLGGVPMGTWFKRFAYAYELGNFKILISNYFTPESRIHYYRSIRDRIQHVAPFLHFDSDPYLVVIDGRLQWIVDAYTSSNRYPYSEPLIRSHDPGSILTDPNISHLASQNINYIRDAVKVVVDAFDGSLHFYIVDAADPVLATYRKIFPSLFEPLENASPTLRSHFRYPHNLFKIQAQIYREYHMANPEVFYNREDLWRLPTQLYEGNPVVMEPYYAIMRLPQTPKEEFIQILPFTPANKDNMVSWLAGRSDAENYGKLLLYEFPKQQLTYGPSQIEAFINQTPEISQQLTLWGQQGSAVIRGNLLVIPIEQSLLYIEPIYLRSEQGELPELKRVIVFYGNQKVMQPTLEAALATIFGEGRPLTTAAAVPIPPDQPPEPPPTQPLSETVSALVRSALTTYQQGQEALRQGDWQRYGTTQRELESLLQQLDTATQSAPAP